MVRLALASWLAAACWAAPPASPFAGSAACARCHKALYENYSRTAMGRSMARADASHVMAKLPVPDLVQSAALDRVFRVFMKDGQLHQSAAIRRGDTEVFSTAHPLAYAVGSGVNGITFLVQRGQHLFQAPLSYYARSGSWGLSPGYEVVDHGFSRAVPDGCLACHAGRTKAVAERAGQYETPPFEELAIGCEKCHGPGAAHAANARRDSIVNPRRLPARLAEDICARCHQTGDTRVLLPGKTHGDFRPGRPLAETVAVFRVAGKKATDEDLLEHHAAMQSSQCFNASGGRLTCLTCHNPHDVPAPAMAAAYYRERCLTCHTNASCALPVRERNVGGRANDCAGCHMPRRATTTIAHSALTNHRIVRIAGQPLPDRVSRPMAADPPGLVYWNRPAGDVRPVPALVRLTAYGELMDRFPHLRPEYVRTLEEAKAGLPEYPLVLAALGRKALAEGDAGSAALLRQAIAAGSTAPTTFLDLGEALSREGDLEGAIAALRRGRVLDPYHKELRKSLVLRFVAKKDYAAARAEMQEYLEVFPEDGFMRGLWEKVAAGGGR